MRSFAIALPFLLLALVTTAVFGEEPTNVARASGPVDFLRDVEPIFRQHCYSCHGPHTADAGLRLDRLEDARRGGFSGGQILGGSLDKNELWHRVATPEPDFRMPKNEDPLSARDLDVLKRWIQQGSPWTNAAGLTVSDDDHMETAPGIRDVADSMAKKYAWPLLALCVLLLLAVRARKGSSVWKRILGWLQPAHVVIVACMLMIVSSMGVIKQTSKEKDRAVHKLQDASQTSQVYKYLFGNPPRPHHAPVAPTLDVTYYRGNDERTPNLYNGGKYRTATLSLSLRDKRGNKLSVGDDVPADGLFMRFDIERSPNSAARMYATDRMKGVFLSEVWFDWRTVTRLSKPAIFLETVKENWAWYADVPLGALPDGTHSAYRYVYVNYRDDGRPFSPQAHYGVQADLIIEDGKVAEGSDLWLGNLFWNVAMEPPPVNFKTPAAEWLNHEPLPEIEDGHSYHEKRESEEASTRAKGSH